MADNITLDLYVVVDDNGDYSVHEEDIGEACDRHSDNYSQAPLNRYHIRFTIPQPKPTTVEIEASSVGPGQDQPFGNVARVVYNPD